MSHNKVNHLVNIGTASFVSVLSNIILGLIGLFVLPVLVRTHGTQIASTVFLLFSFVGALKLADFGIFNVLVIMLSKRSQYQFKSILYNGFLVTIPLISIVAIASVLTIYLTGKGSISIYLLTALFITTNMISRVIRCGLDAKKIFFPAVWLLPLSQSIILLSSIFLAENLSYIVLNIALLETIVLIFLILKSRGELIFNDVFQVSRFDRRILKVVIIRSAWQGLANLTNILLTRIDRISVNFLFDTATSAIYIIVVETLQRISIIPISIAKILLPYFSSYGSSFYQKYIYSIICLSIALTGFIFIFIDGIISMIMPSDDITRSLLLSKVFLIGLGFNFVGVFIYTEAISRFSQKSIFALYVLESVMYVILIYFFGSGSILMFTVVISIRYAIDVVGLMLILQRK